MLNGRGFSTRGDVGTVSAASVGVLLHPTYLTPEILSARSALAEANSVSSYYRERLKALVENYPVEWAPASSLFAQLSGHYRSSQDNLALLFGSGGAGAISCYSDPVGCPALAKGLLESLRPFDEAALGTALEALRFKYTLPWNSAREGGSCHESVYLCGDPSPDSFKAESNPKCRSVLSRVAVSKEGALTHMDIRYRTTSDNNYTVSAARDARLPQCRGSAEPCLWSTDGTNFNGQLLINWEGQEYDYFLPVEWAAVSESEYYFRKYSARP